MSAVEAMPASLLMAMICSYMAVFLIGMFSGIMIVDRNKLKKQIKEYQRERDREFRQKANKWDHWDHPVY